MEVLGSVGSSTLLKIFVTQDNLSNALFFLNLKFIRLLRLCITSFSNKLRIHSLSYECLIFR